MAKYGSGIGMKNMMRLEMFDVCTILDKYNVSEEDQSVITDILKEAFYQWCHVNATACITEDVIRQMLDEKNREAFTRLVLKVMLSGAVEKKIEETYAWYDEDYNE